METTPWWNADWDGGDWADWADADDGGADNWSVPVGLDLAEGLIHFSNAIQVYSPVNKAGGLGQLKAKKRETDIELFN